MTLKKKIFFLIGAPTQVANFLILSGETFFLMPSLMLKLNINNCRIQTLGVFERSPYNSTFLFGSLYDRMLGEKIQVLPFN